MLTKDAAIAVTEYEPVALALTGVGLLAAAALRRLIQK